MKFARLLTALLSLLLIFGACSRGSAPADEGTPSAADHPSTPVSDKGSGGEAETEFRLPQKDFNGKTFTFITAADSYSYLDTEEMTGEAVNDAQFETEKVAEDLYNAEIGTTVLTDCSSNDIVTRNFIPMVMAADDSFNSIFANSVDLCLAQIQGVMKNLYDMEAFDFTKPWWPKYSVESLTVAGQMYLGHSALSFSGLADARMMYINKEIAGKYQIGIPYDSVKAGTWTLDGLYAMVRDIYVDVDGDGEKDDGDEYGFGGTLWANNIFALSSGICYYEKTNDENVMRLNFDVEKMSNLEEKIFALYFNTTGSFCEYSPIPTFANGRTMIATGAIENSVSTLRSSEVSYGFLPYPKYDEKQKSYLTYTQGFVFSLPNCNSDEDFDGSVIEALSYLRYEKLIPAYYETTVIGKLADQPDDRDMLVIIYDTMAEAFARIHDGWDGISIDIGGLLENQNPNFASWYGANKSKYEAKIQPMIDFYKEHKK